MLRKDRRRNSIKCRSGVQIRLGGQ